MIHSLGTDSFLKLLFFTPCSTPWMFSTRCSDLEAPQRFVRFSRVFWAGRDGAVHGPRCWSRQPGSESARPYGVRRHSTSRWNLRHPRGTLLWRAFRGFAEKPTFERHPECPRTRRSSSDTFARLSFPSRMEGFNGKQITALKSIILKMRRERDENKK